MGGRDLVGAGWKGRPSLNRQDSPQLHGSPSLEAIPVSSSYLLNLARDGDGSQ